MRFSKIISAAKRSMAKSSATKTIIKSALAGEKAAVNAGGERANLLFPELYL